MPPKNYNCPTTVTNKASTDCQIKLEWMIVASLQGRPVGGATFSGPFLPTTSRALDFLSSLPDGANVHQCTTATSVCDYAYWCYAPQSGARITSCGVTFEQIDAACNDYILTKPEVTLADGGGGVGAVQGSAAIAAGGYVSSAHRRTFSVAVDSTMFPYRVSFGGQPGSRRQPSLLVEPASRTVGPMPIGTATTSPVLPPGSTLLGVNQSVAVTGPATLIMQSGDTVGRLTVSISGSNDQSTSVLMVPGVISIQPPSATTFCAMVPQSFGIGLAANGIPIDQHVLAVSIGSIVPVTATTTVMPASGVVTSTSGSVPFRFMSLGADAFTVSIQDRSVMPSRTLTAPFRRDLPPVLAWSQAPPECVPQGGAMNATVSASDPEGTPVEVRWLLDGVQIAVGSSLNTPSVTSPGDHTLVAVARELGGCGLTSQLQANIAVRPAAVGAGPQLIAAGGVANSAHTAAVAVSGCPDSKVSVSLQGGMGVNVNAVLTLGGVTVGPNQTASNLTLDADGKLFGSLLSPDLEQAVRIDASPGAGSAIVTCVAPVIDLSAGDLTRASGTSGFSVPVKARLDLHGTPVPGHTIEWMATPVLSGCGAPSLQVLPPSGTTGQDGTASALVSGAGAMRFNVIATDLTAFASGSGGPYHQSATIGPIDAMLADEVGISAEGAAPSLPASLSTTIFVGDFLTLSAFPANTGPDCRPNTLDDIPLDPGALQNPTWLVTSGAGIVTPSSGPGRTFTLQGVASGDAVVTCAGYNIASQQIVSLPFTVHVRRIGITVQANPTTIFVGHSSTISAVTTPAGGTLTLGVDQPTVFSLPPVRTSQNVVSITGLGQSPGAAAVTGTYTFNGRSVTDTAFVNVDAFPPPGRGEVRITDIVRVLPGGFEISILDEPVPTGWDIDTGLKIVIRNSTPDTWYATLSDPVDGVFETVTGMDVTVESIGPAVTPAVAVTARPAVEQPAMSRSTLSGVTAAGVNPAGATSGIRSPTPVTLNPRSIITILLNLRFPPAPTPNGGSIADELYVCASQSDGGVCVENKRVKWSSMDIRLALDYPEASQQVGTGYLPLVTTPFFPILLDKWDGFIPGTNADGNGTNPSQITPTQAQAMQVRVVLVAHRDNVEVVTDRVLKQGVQGRLSLALTQVSTYPGVATNWGDPSDTSDDVSFDQLAGGNVKNLSVTLGPQLQANIPLYIKDYAAASHLAASLDVFKGSIRSAAHTNKTTERDLPTDSDHDLLADAWERRVAPIDALFPLRLLSATSDNDTDRFNRQTELGDGLSAWEEYRGFKVQGVHRRTDELGDDCLGADPSVRGGPFVKDMFIEDPNGYFATHSQLIPTYGIVVHVIRPDESFTPSPLEAPERLGQINRLTPLNLMVPLPVVQAQYRLRIVTDPALVAGEYGYSVTRFFRSTANVSIFQDSLEADLTSPTTYGLTRSSDRFIQATQRVLAHEIGHRLTLGHPVGTVAVGRTIKTTDQPLDLANGELAAVQLDAQGKATVVKVRVITEERDIPPPYESLRPDGSLKRNFLELQAPIDIVFPGQPTAEINEKALPSWNLPADIAQPDPQGSSPADPADPTRLTAQYVMIRTAHWFLKDRLSDDQLKLVQGGLARLRLRRFDFSTQPTLHGIDWSDGGSGSVWFPARGIPDDRMRLLRMKLGRDVDPLREEN